MVALGVVVFILAAVVYLQYRQLQYQESFSRVERTVKTGINQLGLRIQKEEIEKEGFPPRKIAKITIKIPRDYSLDGLVGNIVTGLTSARVQLLDIQEENLKDMYRVTVQLGSKQIKTHRVQFILEKAKVALLIDDFGYDTKRGLLDAFFNNWDIPFTVSIIPGTPFAGEIAQMAHNKNKQILVHMPMEPKGSFNNRYKWIVMEKMSQEKIEEVIREAIDSVPYAEGLNNHMGSLVTTDREAMEPVLKVLQDKDMFFVDSRTSSDSIAYSLARELKVRTIYNSVFLDNEKKPEYIEKQFNELISIGLDRGEVMGLAHADPVTSSTLIELTKKCDKRKISFIFLSEIVN